MGKTLSAEALKLLDEADAILEKAFDEVRALLRNVPDDFDRFPVCFRCDCEGFVVGGSQPWKCGRLGCDHPFFFHGGI